MGLGACGARATAGSAGEELTRLLTTQSRRSVGASFAATSSIMVSASL
jgi:hypothetical protein